MVRIETGPAYCLTARSCIASVDGSDRDGPGVLPDGSLVYRFGGWLGSRWARRIARQLARGASADGSDEDRPGVLPDGSLTALWRMVQFEMGPAYCLTARSRCFGGWFDSGWARRTARRLARSASADGSIRDGPGVLPDGSLVYRFGGRFGSRRTRRIARRLARSASADGSDGDGSGVLPDGSLAALW